MNIKRIVKVEQGAFEDVGANIVVYILETHHSQSNMVQVEDWEHTSVTSVPQANWNNEQAVFTINVAVDDQAVINKITTRSIPLFEEYEYVLGMQLYHNTVHSKDEIEGRIYHSPSYKPDYIEEFGGSNVGRYALLRDSVEWVKPDPNRAYSIPDKRFFEGRRILIREIPSVTSLMGTIIEEYAYHTPSEVP